MPTHVLTKKGGLSNRCSLLEMTTKRLRFKERGEEVQILSPTKRMRSEAAQEEKEEEIDVVSGSQDIDTFRSRMCSRADMSDRVGFSRHQISCLSFVHAHTSVVPRSSPAPLS